MAVTKKPALSRAFIAKARKVLEFAKQRATEVPNRMELRNALFTPAGMVSVTFPTEAERRAFFRTKEAEQIRTLIINLPEPPLSDEVIVIRVPFALNGKSRKR